MLRREGLVDDWYDRQILAGENIDREVVTNLRASQIFLALVSPDFLASDYCYEKEMAEAFKRHEAGSMRVIPVILEPCDWKTSPLGKLRALPKDGKPISLWTNENSGYLDVATELRRILSTPEQDSNTSVRPGEISTATTTKIQSRQYRIKREFDAIDREEFRAKAFSAIQDYFQRSIDELNQIGDPIRARFERIGDTAFSCTVLNKAARDSEAHITVHGEGSTGWGEISYSYSRRASATTANGFIRVEADDYELYLALDHIIGGSEKERLSAEEAAEKLWREFVSRAGIDHD